MDMKQIPLFIVSLAILCSIDGCKKGATEPADSHPLLSERELGNIILSLTDYDVVRITHALGSDLRNPSIVGIGVGIRSTDYREIKFFPSAYDAAFMTYAIHFDFTVRVDSSLIRPAIALRYYMTDSSHLDIDTLVSLSRFPYASANVFVTSAIIPGQGNLFQDIDRNGNLFYFHPMGPLGLYVYDIAHATTTTLLGYSSGDFIAADSIFVFCDISHDRIHRYNVNTNAVDLQFPQFVSDDIWGLDTFTDHVYVLLRSHCLKKLTMDGVLVDSISFVRQTFYMTIDDSIVYSVLIGNNYDPTTPDLITRFDLRTRQFLPDVKSPARSLAGIRIVNGALYYCDWFKNMVGVLPVSDLTTAVIPPGQNKPLRK